MEEIKAGKYVETTYELYVGGADERELMEEATKERPLQFVFMAGQMLEAFEAQLLGKVVGDKFDFVIPVEDAYGEYFEDRVLTLNKEIFVVNGRFDEDMIFEGNVVPMMNSNGEQIQGSVVEVQEENVIMDFNHPLAGEELHFIGEVLTVRDATPEEIAPSHGCGGNCGGCCGSCGDEEGEGSCGCH